MATLAAKLGPARFRLELRSPRQACSRHSVPKPRQHRRLCSRLAGRTHFTLKMDPNYLSHLIQQITSSLDALQRAQLISDTDLNLIKSRLPTPDGRPAPPQLALTSVAGLGTVTAVWDYRSENVSVAVGRGERLVREGWEADRARFVVRSRRT